MDVYHETEFAVIVTLILKRDVGHCYTSRSVSWRLALAIVDNSTSFVEKYPVAKYSSMEREVRGYLNSMISCFFPN